MKQIILLCTFLVSLVMSGCAVGPLVGHETARTVGKGSHEIVGGFGQSGFVAKWNYGLLEDLDIGIHAELFSIGVRAKYAFINGYESGFSLATAFGIGESLGGQNYYGEILTSYMVKQFEPYLSFRLVRVKTDPVEFKDEPDQEEADFTINSYKFNYAQFLYGTRYWFNSNWVLSVEGSTFSGMSAGFKVAKWNLFSASLGYRF